MTTLTEFLLARIAEDEHRRTAYWHDMECAVAFDASAECGCGSQARVLAECEAKRRIVERCADMLAVDYWEYEDAPNLAEEILCDLANVYADHPDCREEWKP